MPGFDDSAWRAPFAEWQIAAMPADRREPLVFEERVRDLLVSVGLQEVITTPHGDALDQGKAIAAGLGYEVAFGASHGEGFSFGNAIYDGSAGNVPLNSPMVSLADI